MVNDREPSRLVRINRLGAERLAKAYGVSEEKRAAFVEQTTHVLLQTWSDLFGGEQVRVTVAKVQRVLRDARRSRILQAVKSGEPPASVARREGVSISWVQKVLRRGQ